MTRPCHTEMCADPAAGRGKYCHRHSPRRAREVPLMERLLARTTKGEECWTWRGYINPKGYAAYRYGTQNVSVHRALYLEMVGEIPDGLVLDHVCHNRGCVNPDHLRPVTSKQNTENYTDLRVNNTSGYHGVRKHSSGLWAATVWHNGKAHHGGYFKDASAAGEAARALRLVLHSHNDLDRAA